MQTPIKTSYTFIQKTPTPIVPINFNVPNYLNQQYGQQLTDLDDKVTYLEKLLSLMRLPKPSIEPHITAFIPDTRKEKTVKSQYKLPVEHFLSSQKLLWSLLELLGIEPEEFQERCWSLDEGFISALREQLNIDKWLDSLKGKFQGQINLKDLEQFFKELEDLLLVCVMTIDYLRCFKDRKKTQEEKPLVIKKEMVVQVDTIPDYEAIIERLRREIRENEEEKALLTRKFTEKVDGLHINIKDLEFKTKEAEEKRNESLEVIKENVIEKGLLYEEIELLKKKAKEEGEEENEERKKTERRKKYALIDNLHERLKNSDQANKILAEKMEDLIRRNKKLENAAGN